MTDSNIPDALPKSPEEVALLEQAITSLLAAANEKWQPVDGNDLTSFESRAQFLLVAAGMIERRLAMKVECLIGSFSAEFEIIATGECGMEEALDPVVRQMWSAVGEAWAKVHGEGPSTYFEIVSDSWRLTDQGVIARNDLAKTAVDRQTVFDFVLRQHRFHSRPGVRGAGRMVKITRGDRSSIPEPAAPPMPVAVTNWSEGVRLFVQEVGKEIGEAFARKPTPELPAVSINPPQIVIEGMAYALTLEAAHYLHVLASRYGERMSDREVVSLCEYLQISYSERPRLKALRDSLPAAAKAWIDSSESGTKFRRPE